MDNKDALLLIELDKGGEHLGPLFEEPRRRLQEDPIFRQAWGQYQALRALAWEAAPELEERLLRQGLQASRRQEVERRLARATGSQDVARELLLNAPSGKRGGLPIWASFLLLLGALGLGWFAFGPSAQAPETSASFSAADSANVAANAEAPLAFEFPAQTPGEAPLGLPPSNTNDESRSESEDARRARRLLVAHLKREETPKATVIPTAAPTKLRPAPTKAMPRPTTIPTLQAAPMASSPSAQPTVITRAALADIELVDEITAQLSAMPSPTLAPSHTSTAVATSPKASEPSALGGTVTEASFEISGAQFPAQATLALPEAGAVDLRLFDMRGRLVHRYAEGELAAGRWRYKLGATDENGRPLPKGSYYLRVITRWFSKVEALEQL